MPYLTLLKKVSENSCICPFIRIHTKSYWGLFWAETHPPSKFCWNGLSSFCVIMITNQQTTSLVEIKFICCFSLVIILYSSLLLCSTFLIGLCLTIANIFSLLFFYFSFTRKSNWDQDLFNKRDQSSLAILQHNKMQHVKYDIQKSNRTGIQT